MAGSSGILRDGAGWDGLNRDGIGKKLEGEQRSRGVKWEGLGRVGHGTRSRESRGRVGSLCGWVGEEGDGAAG